MRRVGRSLQVWALIVVLAVGAVGATVLHGSAAPPLDAHLPWSVLLLGFVLAELCVVHVRLGKEMYSSSLDEIPLVVGLFFVDPVTLVVVRLLGRGMVLLLHRRHGPVKLCFNLAQGALEVAVAVLLWQTLTAGHDVLGPAGWAAALGVVIVTDLLAGASIWAAIALTQRDAQPSLSRAALGAGLLAATVNVCLALVAVAVIVVDWRASWTLVVVGGLLFLAHRAHAVLRQRHASLERLNRFTERISADLDVQSVARAVMLEVRELLSADRAEIVLGDLGVLSCSREGGFRQDDGLTGSLAYRLRGRLLDHAVLAPRNTRDVVLKAWLHESGVRDAVLVPLRVDDHVFGALTAADNLGHTGTFSAADVQVLEALANHAAVAVQNARLAQRLQEQVREKHAQARHDSLTGLANRLSLEEHLADRLARPASCAVLLLDLDGFKDVNDTLGHATGDELLRQVSQRLAAIAPPGALLARLGGDEFVLVAAAQDDADAYGLADVLRESLAPAFSLQGITVSIGASTGMALSPRDGTDASALLRRADIAMYVAKQQGMDAQVYSPEIDEHTAERLALAAELRVAVQSGALTVSYQPKVVLGTGQVQGVEALVRWSHPERGFISPEEFIPVAERTGLIVELTHHVLDTALAQCAQWRAAGLLLQVAVNLSPRLLQDDSFEHRLAAALVRHDVPADALTLEVTESSLMRDLERTVLQLQRLRKLGVHLSIDDLGTGYSSLAHLKRMPVDEVKLDKSFVLQIASNQDDQAIVRAMVEVGHRLRMQVVAEGVEDEATYHLLRRLGCDVAQGFWLSRPVPGDQIASWVAGWSAPTGVMAA